MNLAGRHIIVTGAGAGIGLGIARQCRAAGAEVTCFDVNENVRANVQALGASFEFVDVSDASLFQQAIEAAFKAAGRLDGLVNNAGVTIQVPFLDMSAKQMETLWAVNQRSVLVGCQTAGRLMTNGGAIVNVASNHARSTDAGFEGYSGSKGAVVAMTRAMAWSLGPHNVRVNALCPGMTQTELVKTAMIDSINAVEFRSWGADNEVSTVEEIGDVAVFLLSDSAMALNGSEIIADRGMSARLGASK